MNQPTERAIEVALGAVACPPDHDGSSGLLADGSRCYVCIGRALYAEVERLRRALAPFAQLADEVGDDVLGEFVLVSYYGTEQRPPTVLHVADLKAARAALAALPDAAPQGSA